MQTSSDPVCSSAGCPNNKKATHPMDYFVPNFGMDQDIMDSQSHEAQSSTKLNHTWKWSPKPNSEEQKDKALMKWGSLTQTAPVANNTVQAHAQSKSDPICDSAHPNCDMGNKKNGDGSKIVNYPVGHQWPLDGDIIDSQKHLDNTEKKLKSKFTVGSKAQISSGATHYEERRNLRSMMMNNWGTQQ